MLSLIELKYREAVIRIPANHESCPHMERLPCEGEIPSTGNAREDCCSLIRDLAEGSLELSMRSGGMLMSAPTLWISRSPSKPTYIIRTSLPFHREEDSLTLGCITSPLRDGDGYLA